MPGLTDKQKTLPEFLKKKIIRNMPMIKAPLWSLIKGK